MKCPHCNKELYSIGTVVRATQYFDVDLKEYSGIKDIEETIEYYCPECGNELPFEEIYDYIDKLLEEDD